MNQVIIPKEKNIKVYVNEKKLSTLVSFELEEDIGFYPVKEILSGENGFIKNSERYKLKLTLLGEEEFPEDFFIKISTPFAAKTFTDCRVTKVKEKAHSGDKFYLEYSVEAEALHRKKL